jgi:hypothetical protein
VDLDKFMAIIKTIEEFWLSIVKLPGASVSKATV